MIPTLCLMSCMLATAQSGERAEWLFQTRLNAGQELVYRGTFEEQSSGSEVQFTRGYRLHTVAFVMNATNKEAEVGFLTLLRPRTARTGRVEDAIPHSVRLEVLRVDSLGKVSGTPMAPLTLPLDGPPRIELGPMVEFPKQRIGPGARWAIAEQGRPGMSWTIVGTETINATSCVKLTGLQQSEDWDAPRADRTAWRRQDTVWVAPRLGIAFRVERVIERRAPAHSNPGYKSVLRYDLDQRTEYPAGLGDDIRREITQAHAFMERAAPLFKQPATQGPAIEALLGRIKYHQDHYPAMPPYGEALKHLQRRLEAARRGETAPESPEPEREIVTTAAIGRVAPDVILPDYLADEHVRLTRWRGKPVLMIFYSPTSIYAETVLRLGQEVHEATRGEVAVLGLAMTQDAELVRKQRAALHLAYPLLNGTGLRQTFEVEGTPKVMVLDPSGIVRGSQLGWGTETRETILKELTPWVKRGGLILMK